MAEEAFATLNDGSLAPTVDGLLKAQVLELYKVQAKRTHPDMGGTPEAFAAVDRAKHVLLHWLERAGPAVEVPHGDVQECLRCKGKGYTMQQRAFRQMRMQCPSCRGTGEIYDREESADKEF